MRFLYDILFGIYALVYLPILVLRGKWHSGFRERFGFFPPDVTKLLSETRNIWVHAVSVGEVAVVEGVITGLRKRYPDHRIVLTVTTKTGYSFAQRKYQGTVMVFWSPLDFSLTVQSFIRTIHPVFYVAAETELWPNLFRSLSLQGIKIFVVNGRISDQAFPRYMLARKILRNTLARVRLFIMQSKIDADRILAMGAPSEAVRIAGNIKFDNMPGLATIDPAKYGFDPRHLVFLGGSTHPGEEAHLINIYKSFKDEYPALRLVLAPRHPERAALIAELVRQSGLTPQFFSKNTNVIGTDSVLVIDTIGHLIDLYSLATIVFVGKSLSAGGGHNIIEPAVFGKPVMIGPMMGNFRDITSAFLAEKAVIQVPDALALKESVRQLLADPAQRRTLGELARMVVQRNRGAGIRILDLVAEAVGDLE